MGNILAKAAALRVNLNIDDAPIASRSHTRPSHSQFESGLRNLKPGFSNRGFSETSRLLTSSLTLGVPVPRATQCM